MLNSRHTDCTDYGYWTEKMRAWSAVYLAMDLISRGRKTWAGDGWRAWGGGMDGKPWPELDFNEKFMCQSTRDGRFRR